MPGLRPSACRRTLIPARGVLDTPAGTPMGYLPTATENEVLQACLSWLHFNGVDCWRQGNTGVWRADIQRHVFHGLKGVSDILGILPPTSSKPGAFLAVETKRPGNKPTPDQFEFMD